MLKKITFSLLITMLALLTGATLFEKWYGTEAAARCIYGSTWFASLWALLAVASVLYLFRRQLFRRPAPFLLHAALVIILLGAGITHWAGQQGTIELRTGENVDSFRDATDADLSYTLPFRVRLEEFELLTYPGTETPMDYVSHLTYSDRPGDTVTVSMNHIATHHGYRFYQSGYDQDLDGVTLSVSHDPWGIAVTYMGYALLFISMLILLLRHDEGFRRQLRGLQRERLHTGGLIVLALLSLAAPCNAASSEHHSVPKHLTREAADDFGRLYVLWNGRICPVQSLARDFTLKLYGRDTYRGLTAEQVLTGWYFYPTSWQAEPLKGNARRTAESTAAIRMLLSGSLLHIYPCRTDSTTSNTNVHWYSPAERLPETLAPDQWMFIRRSLDYIGQLAMTGRNDELRYTLQKLQLYQQKEAGEVLPSDLVVRCERIYNGTQWCRPLAMACLTVGLLSFIGVIILSLRGRDFGQGRRYLLYRCGSFILVGGLAIVALYLLFNLTLRGIVGGHLPMSNGFETMQLMSLCSAVLALVLCRRRDWLLPFGYMLTGLTLLVSMLGQSNPAVTPLVPVLASPLLCIHVAIVMLAYTLLAFLMMVGVAALLLNITDRHSSDSRRQEEIEAQVRSLQGFSRVILYPAVFLLAAGIFIGAIWANVSWGRYWGWDPKEVWALISLLLYAMPLHSESLTAFRRPMFYHGFMVAAFLAVLMTYFGVNFVLGGMHSYANG